MANITTILGTDSISSSRIVLNDNFTAVNDELTTISGLFNATYTNLTLTATMQAATVLVPSGINVSAAACTITPNTTFDGNVKLNKGLKHSYSTAISVIPGTGQYTLTTYLWDAATTGTWALNPGDTGQEITIIPTTGILTLSNGGGTIIQTSTGGNITVAQNANITLRFINTLWHVVATSPTGVTGY